MTCITVNLQITNALMKSKKEVTGFFNILEDWFASLKNNSKYKSKIVIII